MRTQQLLVSGCSQKESVPVAEAGLWTSKPQPGCVPTSSGVLPGGSAGQTTSNSAQQSSPAEQQDNSQRVAQGSADVGTDWPKTPRGIACGASACAEDELCRLQLLSESGQHAPPPPQPLPQRLEVPLREKVVKATEEASPSWWGALRSVEVSAPCRIAACVHADQGGLRA